MELSAETDLIPESDPMPNETPLAERVASLEAMMESDREVLRGHVQDCFEVRRRNETQLGVIGSDVKTLLAQSNQAAGRGAENTRLLGGIPTAFWSITIQGLGWLIGASAIVAVLHFWHPDWK
jgi:hypothetical protein